MPSRSRVVVAGAIAGLVVGVGLAALVVSSLDVGSGSDSDVVSGEPAAREFVAAWERSKLGTYFVVSDYLRETPAGELTDSLQLAQRPPDYIRSQFGNVEARLGDAPVSCYTVPTGEVSCIQGVAETTYAEIVEEEVGRFDNYFFNRAVPLYRVQTTGDGCFDLILTQVFLSPPYGESATFCFDEETGAVIFSEIRQIEGTTTTRAVEVRGEVTDADFLLPAPLGEQ
jgi:hypothetical protein